MNRKPLKRRTAISVVLTGAILIAIGFFAAHAGMRTLYPMQYSATVEQCSREFGVDSDLVYAVIRTESGFDPLARSEVGAMGLMQIMPDTFLWLQNRLEPDAERTAEMLYDPQINIRYGVYFLSLLDDMFDDDVLTIAAYHAGQNRVATWLDEHRIPRQHCTANDIPSSVTRHYVNKVQSAWNIYKKLYD